MFLLIIGLVIFFVSLGVSRTNPDVSAICKNSSGHWIINCSIGFCRRRHCTN